MEIIIRQELPEEYWETEYMTKKHSGICIFRAAMSIILSTGCVLTRRISRN